jgi:deazaflavin-dependent oxidoreductase (nitroreductase family)
MPTFSANGRVGRAVRKMSTSPAFRKVAPKVVPALDRATYRLSGGRFMMSNGMVPVLILTTTGRKSGLPRESPLACVPDDDGWYVVGSNFARAAHPAWSSNLIAQPEAKVSFRRRTVPVTARLLSDDEKAEVWTMLTRVWPAYADYATITDRNLRVFHLTRQSP